MSRTTRDFSAPAKRIAESLELLGVLAEVLEHNGGYKCDEPGEHLATINERGEDGIVRSMRMIAQAAHQELCKLATDLGIAE
ncbi:hypothetical protein [Pseudomonas mosselii]|uniref:hypothetical protein n=1 Tax=Pseudomonas mosselii TaxID=78327 RepID=UPI000C12BDF4|nr:hypothetical protein [Pseudomonas mosselii]